MKVDDLRKGMILQDRRNARHIQIKEITRINDIENKIYLFVCSKNCKYASDSITSITRQILKPSELIEHYNVIERVN